MGLGRHALGQGQFHRRQHGLFVVLKNQGEDVGITVAQDFDFSSVYGLALK